MSTASDLLSEGVPAESLRKLRETRAMYARLSWRWRQLSLLIEWNAFMLGAVNGVVLLGKWMGLSDLSTSDTLITGVALSLAGMTVQAGRRYLGADGRSVLYRAAADSLRDAHAGLAHDTNASAAGLAQACEHELMAAADLVEPDREMVVITIA